MNAATNIEPIRHGDVILWPVPPVDVSKLEQMKPTTGQPIVLTEGSATGHEHVLEGGAASVYADGDGPGERVLVLREPGRLVHAGAAPRHEPIELPADTYRQSIKRQAVGEGWAPVED